MLVYGKNSFFAGGFLSYCAFTFLRRISSSCSGVFLDQYIIELGAIILNQTHILHNNVVYFPCAVFQDHSVKDRNFLGRSYHFRLNFSLGIRIHSFFVEIDFLVSVRKDFINISLFQYLLKEIV